MKPLGPSSALCAALVAAWLSGLAPVQAASAQVGVRKAPRISTLNGFVENRGQWVPEVLFFAQRGGIEATLLADALVFQPTVDPECGEPTPEPLVLRLPGAAVGRVVEGAGEFPTLHHFILASGSASDVRGYETVLYRDVQPGIDIRVRFDGERFAYDLLLDAGADLAGLVLAVEGAEGLDVVDGTTLVMQTAAGVVEQRIGASWQVDATSGANQAVESRFRVEEPVSGFARFGFEVPERDPARELVIDPSLSWATYVGGPNQELLIGMDVDDAGAVYILCSSFGGTPTTPGAIQRESTPVGSLWVGKLAAGGALLEWGTFLGGSDADHGGDIELDANGTVVVAGKTWSTDFPVTAGSLQPVHGGNAKADIFVTRLDPSGSSVVWSTFFGKTMSEEADAIALSPSGDIVVGGHYVSGFDPLDATPGVLDPVYDEGDQMLFRLSADGSSLVFLTYFKASGIFDVVLDGSSSIYFGGTVFASDAPIPATPGAFKEGMPPGGSSEGYVGKMSSDGSQLFWATYLGGDEGGDVVWAIALDAASAVYVGGQTNSNDFPVTPGAFDSDLNGGSYGFVTKLLPGGSDVVWSTFLGSTCACGGGGHVEDIAVDAAGNVHAAGFANQPGWPTTPDAFQSFYVGPFPSSDGVLTKLDTFGEQLVYSTWFGGDGSDTGALVALNAAGLLHLALDSSSDDMPVTPGAYQSSNAGSVDVVVAEFDVPLLPWRVFGGGLAGVTDTPNLAGTGALTPDSPTRISVRGAFPSSIGWFFVGFTTINLPLLGGTLVPWPNIYFSVPTDSDGAIDLPFFWPGLPSGSSLYFQYWVIDPGAPEFFAVTNALQAIAQAQ